MARETRGTERCPMGLFVHGGVVAEDSVDPVLANCRVHGSGGDTLVTVGVENGDDAPGYCGGAEPVMDDCGALLPELREGRAPPNMAGLAHLADQLVQGKLATCSRRTGGR